MAPRVPLPLPLPLLALLWLLSLPSWDDAPRLSAIDSGIDTGLEHIVGKLLARDPEQRMPSARALSRALLPLSRDRLAAERRLAARLTPRTLPEIGTPSMHDSAHETARVA